MQRFTFRPVSAESAISHVAFLALFPGYFFYHTALGTGYINAFLGGYFSWMALLFMPFLLAAYGWRLAKLPEFLTPLDVFFFLYLLYFSLIVGFNYANHADIDVITEHLMAIYQFATVFLVFKMANFQARYMRWSAVLSLLGMALLIFYFSTDGWFYLKQETTIADADSLSSYQGFARSFFVTALVAIAFIRQLPLRLLLYAICVPALFLNSARSELLCMGLTALVVELIYSRHKLVALALTVLPFVMLVTYLDELKLQFSQNRVILLLDLANDSSWQARAALFSNGMRSIAEHPFLGDYGSYAAYGGAGSYVHNIVSAWVDLGLVGFLYLFIMILIPTYLIAKEIGRQSTHQRSSEFVLVFNFLFVTLLLLLTAKNFTDPLIAAALGRYAHYRIRSRGEKAEEPVLRTSGRASMTQPV
jgi:hypothetical protein